MSVNALAQAFESHQNELNNRTVSDKGDNAYRSTLKPTLDFYASMGALRGKEDEFIGYLSKSFETSPLETIALLFKLRDIRNGMGERHLFRLGLSYLEPKVDLSVFIPLIAKYGRFDDFYELKSKESIKQVVEFFMSIIRPEGNDTEDTQFYRGLLAKWLPRKPKTESQRYLLSCLRSKLKMTPAELRRWMVSNTKVVEQLMCANKWNEVPYSNIPSQAARIYRNAFMRHDESRYLEYIELLTKPVEERDPNVKINAGAIFPYQIMNVGLCYRRDEALVKLANAQWEALPDFLNGSSIRILPMIDVSGSMDCSAGTEGGVTCMDVAISLGVYLAQKQTGEFKNTYLSFSSEPNIHTFNDGDNIQSIYNRVKQSDWGMNTDLSKALDRILELQNKYNIPEDKMPEVLVILSDMNFDEALSEGSFFSRRVDPEWEVKYQEVQRKYIERGLTPPKVVFWNLHHNGTFTCKIGDQGVCEISGFSPSVFKDVLSTIKDISPETVFLKGIEGYLNDVKQCLNGKTLDTTPRELTYPGIRNVSRLDLLEALVSNIFPPGIDISVSSEQVAKYLKNKKGNRVNVSVSSTSL